MLLLIEPVVQNCTEEQTENVWSSALHPNQPKGTLKHTVEAGKFGFMSAESGAMEDEVRRPPRP